MNPGRPADTSQFNDSEQMGNPAESGGDPEQSSENAQDNKYSCY